MEKVVEDASHEFKWLQKRSVGGKGKQVTFYESFIYDGVKYVQYDCVYMYKEGLREPYIGKLIKIWGKPDNTKKVKVQWFFRPEEISKWLGDTKTLKNEIFFASGSSEGVGLANINPLEAIAGRCNVVCVSKDSRNPQPSDEELKAADFIFYRTFDVQSCTILDKMDEKVGGLEIEHIFNRKEGENTSTLPESTSDRKEENQNTTTCSGVQQLLTNSLPNKLKDGKEDVKLLVNVDAKGDSQGKDIPNLLVVEPSSGVDSKKVDKTNSDMGETDSRSLKADKDNSKLKDIPFSKDKADKDEMKASIVPVHKVEAKERNKPPTGSDNLHDRPVKKIQSDRKSPKEKQVETDSRSLKADKDNSKLKDIPFSKDKADKDEIKADKVEAKERNKPPTGSDNLHDRPVKKIRSDKKSPKEKQVETEVARDSERLKDVPSKKSKVDNSIKLPVDGKLKHEDKLLLDVDNVKASGTSDSCHVKVDKDNSKLKDIPCCKGKADNNEMKVSTVPVHKVEAKERNKSPTGSDKLHDRPLKKLKSVSPTRAYQELVVSRKPNAEKSSWFRRLPWEERLKNAYDQGTAILLHNVDPNYTSEEVEDIIWHAFNKEHCEAKILQHTAVSSPHYGQALILLKTKEAAQRILAKLDEECLMLSNGRPLVGTTCPPISLRKNSNFFGHLVIDKIRLQNQREMDEAVSTSHFSQPNTIEYDMAMEWSLLQSRSKKWWEMIHKQQGDELKKLETILRKKRA